jgi:hypothetical protein
MPATSTSLVFKLAEGLIVASAQAATASGSVLSDTFILTASALPLHQGPLLQSPGFVVLL